MFKQLFYSTFFIFLSAKSIGQSYPKSPLIGSFILEKLEISQQFDSNLVKIPLPVWSLYNNPSFMDSLVINDGLNFKRSFSFNKSAEQTLEGSLQLSNDTLMMRRGILFSIDFLIVERMDAAVLVLRERHKMRQVRRTFRRRH